MLTENNAKCTYCQKLLNGDDFQDLELKGNFEICPHCDEQIYVSIDTTATFYIDIMKH